MADIDIVLERLVTDASFRRQLVQDAAGALSGYDLSEDDVALLASSLDDGDTGQRGVETRTSKSAVLGLLASLGPTGGGSGSGPVTAPGKGVENLLAPQGFTADPDLGAEVGNLFAPGTALGGDTAPGSDSGAESVKSTFTQPDGVPSSATPPVKMGSAPSLSPKLAEGSSSDAPVDSLPTAKDGAGLDGDVAPPLEVDGGDDLLAYKDPPAGKAALPPPPEKKPDILTIEDP